MDSEENNVIDFTAYKDAKQTPTPSLLEWIADNLARAKKADENQRLLQERKNRNDNILKSWRVNTNEGGRA